MTTRSPRHPRHDPRHAAARRPAARMHSARAAARTHSGRAPSRAAAESHDSAPLVTPAS